MEKSSPAIKSGFLVNKATLKTNPIVSLHEKVLGPESLIQAVFPVAKNFIIIWLCPIHALQRTHFGAPTGATL
jgi:hypothetical protein